MARPAKDPNAPKPEPRKVFVEAANKRTNMAIKALANVAKLPVKGRNPGDVEKIVRGLRAQIEQTEARLTAATPEPPAFTLD